MNIWRFHHTPHLILGYVRNLYMFCSLKHFRFFFSYSTSGHAPIWFKKREQISKHLSPYMSYFPFIFFWKTGLILASFFRLTSKGNNFLAKDLIELKVLQRCSSLLLKKRCWGTIVYLLLNLQFVEITLL